MLPIFTHARIRQAATVAAIACLCILLYAFLKPQNEPPPQQQTVRQTLATITVPIRIDQGDYEHSEAVMAGDTLEHVLQRTKLPASDIQNILRQSPIDAEQLLLRPNQTIRIRSNAQGQILRVQFFNDSDGETALIILEKHGQNWQAKVGDIHSQTHTILKAVPIRTSFRGDLARADIPVAIRESLQEMFGERLNLNSLSKGDSIRILYDKQYFNGEQLTTGDIHGVEISHKGQLYSAYLFGQAEHAQHYDETGEPMRQGFEILPVAGARMSSPYGFRTHPVLGGVRMHTGIDYAAPTGTPIVAPNAGFIEYQGWRGGYGHTVILRHNEHLETLYAHLSRYAATAPLGSYVQAGDVIGYVGSTGISTGPHLHYEVRLHGQHVNPAAIALPARRLTETELPQFFQRQQHIQTRLAALRNLTHATAEPD